DVRKSSRGLQRSSSARSVLPAPVAPAPTPTALPETIGGCRIEKQIGEGGMGRVLRGHHLGLDRPMAVKVLSDKFVTRPGAVDTLFTEARTLAKLDHPNIVRVFNVDKDPSGLHFVITELLEGGSLEELALKSGRKLPIDDAVRLVCEAAAGLHHAHEAGLIHRDVK